MQYNQFEILKVNSNYEIEKQYPHRIRKLGSDKFITENENAIGYIRVFLNPKSLLKHRIIGLQWIENDDPETKTQIDHINRIRTDNRIENLRWVTPSENMKNKKSRTRNQEYLEDFPEQTLEISDYNNHDFEELYFDILNNRFIKRTNSGRVKVIKPFLSGNLLRIAVNDINNICRQIGYEKLIRTCRKLAIDLEELNQRTTESESEE